MAITSAVKSAKTVADPNAEYESIRPLWSKSRAVIGGERFVKDYDASLDTLTFQNLLLPFSPSMTAEQYEFYKAEAELPGIVSQYSRTLIGGLLRKQPQLTLPESAPAEAYDWIMNNFSQNNASLVSFLDEALWEEIQTSRAWVHVDYPNITNAADLTRAETADIKPYPVLWPAESVINWKMSTNPLTGAQQLMRVIVRQYESSYDDNEFHAKLLDTVFVHELFENKYRVRKFQKGSEDTSTFVVNGKVQQLYSQGAGGGDDKLSAFKLIETFDNIMCNGAPLTVIPAWPLNGSVAVQEPLLMPFIDREVALYNKFSRRNHLLYGAATYTPIISSNMSDDDFDAIVAKGLGSWLRLQQGDSASVLDTPTKSLVDMDRAIAAGIEELAKLGIRMMAPEKGAQSGVALDIRNAGQTAQLGTLNTKISNQMAAIVAFMLNWRYDLQINASDVGFELSADFNPTPLGADWLRLATEWYEKGYIPRSVWLLMLKQNDMVDADYDDEDGKQEIDQDGFVSTKRENMKFADDVTEKG